MLGLSLSLTRAGVPRAFAELNLLSSALDPRITFTRASTKTYVGADGLLHTAAANECPLEYDAATLQPVGRSFWEARTNLLLNSDAPAAQSITTTAQQYTLSFTGTGTVTLSGTYAGSKAGAGSGPANRVSMTFTATAGTLTVTPSGDVQQFQLEAASTPGPYIPTTSATVTRAADVATVNDLSTLRYSKVAGTWYAEAYAPASPFKNGRLLGLNSPNAPITINAPNGALNAYDGTVLSTPNTVVVGGVNKFASASDATVKAVCLNGGAVNTGASSGGAPYLSATYASIGYQAGQSSWNAPICLIRYYPRRLTDAQLQAQTNG